MAVKIGSARMGSNGKITGDTAGDQTGKEVSTQNWYLHAKGWHVFRAKDAKLREFIALAMEMACKNNKIGYDQNQRNTLYNLAKALGFDPSKVDKACETDCSALVRVCVMYAITRMKLNISVPDMRTATESTVLMKTGLFTKLTDDTHCKKETFLARGDILCTRTSGHTVVVLSNGAKCDAGSETIKPLTLGDRTLYNTCEGADVVELQKYLIQLGYSCGSWGADGDYGDATEYAVMQYQNDHDLEKDGIAGEKTIGSILDEINKTPDTPPLVGDKVKIVGGNCWIRSEPNTAGDKLGVAYAGFVYPWNGKEQDGWYGVALTSDAVTGWVSGKYSRVEA